MSATIKTASIAEAATETKYALSTIDKKPAILDTVNNRTITTHSHVYVLWTDKKRGAIHIGKRASCLNIAMRGIRYSSDEIYMSMLPVNEASVAILNKLDKNEPATPLLEGFDSE